MFSSVSLLTDLTSALLTSYLLMNLTSTSLTSYSGVVSLCCNVHVFVSVTVGERDLCLAQCTFISHCHCCCFYYFFNMLKITLIFFLQPPPFKKKRKACHPSLLDFRHISGLRWWWLVNKSLASLKFTTNFTSHTVWWYWVIDCILHRSLLLPQIFILQLRINCGLLFFWGLGMGSGWRTTVKRCLVLTSGCSISHAKQGLFSMVRFSCRSVVCFCCSIFHAASRPLVYFLHSCRGVVQEILVMRIDCLFSNIHISRFLHSSA